MTLLKYFINYHNKIKREIILGANISKELKSIIIGFCVKRNIPCYKSLISNLKYDMEKTLIQYCL